MKILLAGKSGSGKDYLAGLLEADGHHQLITYTTREQRYSGENTHIFIAPEDVDKYPERFLETTINGHTYFATREAVNDSDVLILDPQGIKDILKAFPDEDFTVCYVMASDAKRLARMITRVVGDRIHPQDVNAMGDLFSKCFKVGDDERPYHIIRNHYCKAVPELGELVCKVFDRYVAERNLFKALEKKIEQHKFPKNVVSVSVIHNDYCQDTLVRAVYNIEEALNGKAVYNVEDSSNRPSLD